MLASTGSANAGRSTVIVPAEIIACKHFFGVRHEPQERLLLFLFVVFTERPSDRIRIISARPATQEENDEYYKNYDAR